MALTMPFLALTCTDPLWEKRFSDQCIGPGEPLVQLLSWARADRILMGHTRSITPDLGVVSNG
jgi:hypothetical protein